MRGLAPDVEAYSIDEAFVHLASTRSAAEQARDARATVRRWTGIPTRVGIGPTKTLAKIANRFARQYPEYAGVFDLAQRRDVDDLLSLVHVGEVWGIGPQRTTLLLEHGIENARQLRDASDRWVKRHHPFQGVQRL